MFAQVLFLLIVQAVNERIYEGNNHGAKEIKTRHAIKVRNLKYNEDIFTTGKVYKYFWLESSKGQG